MTFLYLIYLYNYYPLYFTTITTALRPRMAQGMELVFFDYIFNLMKLL